MQYEPDVLAVRVRLERVQVARFVLVIGAPLHSLVDVEFRFDARDAFGKQFARIVFALHAGIAILERVHRIADAGRGDFAETRFEPFRGALFTINDFHFLDLSCCKSSCSALPLRVRNP